MFVGHLHHVDATFSENRLKSRLNGERSFDVNLMYLHATSMATAK